MKIIKNTPVDNSIIAKIMEYIKISVQKGVPQSKMPVHNMALMLALSIQKDWEVRKKKMGISYNDERLIKEYIKLLEKNNGKT